MGTYRHREGFGRACLLLALAAAALAMLALVRPGPAGAERGAPQAAEAKVPAQLVGQRLSRAVKPTARRPAERREAAQAGGLPQVVNEAGEPLEVTGEACEANLALAAKNGLRLPDGWQIRCLGPGLDWEGNSHWGVTCPYSDCPEGAGPYVSISNPTYYVVAHELCHANFGNDEQMADACAAEHGASLETSPYQ